MMLNGPNKFEPTTADCRNLDDNQTLLFFCVESNTSELLNWLFLWMESGKGKIPVALNFDIAIVNRIGRLLWMGWKE